MHIYQPARSLKTRIRTHYHPPLPTLCRRLPWTLRLLHLRRILHLRHLLIKHPPPNFLIYYLQPTSPCPSNFPMPPHCRERITQVKPKRNPRAHHIPQTNAHLNLTPKHRRRIIQRLPQHHWNKRCRESNHTRYPQRKDHVARFLVRTIPEKQVCEVEQAQQTCGYRWERVEGVPLEVFGDFDEREVLRAEAVCAFYEARASP
jgi:hypothetical protein